jgi:putative ABC transport system permease protein
MMRHLRRAYAKLRSLFGNSRVEADLVREINTHLAFLEDEFRSRGLTPQQARLEARRAYGGVEQAKQLHRDERAYQGLAQTAQDIRFALRQLRRSPGFTLSAILTLALGIGANTAIFSVVDAVLLKPLSFPDPDRIVQFSLDFPQGSTPSTSIPDFRLWRNQTDAFQTVAAYDFTPQTVNLTGDVQEQLHGLHVTADYFPLFGASLASGRTFTSKEDSPHAGNVVLLSYATWKGTFGADANIVGKAISLGNEPFTVVGVTSESFHADPTADLWLPFQFDLNSSDQTHYFKVAGRLKAGISLEKANAQLKLAANEARRSNPQTNPQLGFSIQPLRDATVRDVRSLLLLLAGAVSFVLLIACANVANLLLVRATGRKKEFAVRAALGARRRRILSQLLTESILLSSVGGLLGLVVGLIGVRVLLTAAAPNIPRIVESGTAIGLDWRVMVFTLGLSLLTGILFGIIPALDASRPDLNGALTENGNRQGSGPGENKMRSWLVISEVSLAIVLLTGAALLIRTVVALRQVKPGFDPHNVLMMDMSLSGAHFPNTASVSRMVRDARIRLNAIPGIEASALTCWPPFKGRMGLPFTVIGRPTGNQSSTGDGLWMDASPGYLQVLRIPLLRGRDFAEEDDASAPRVVLINDSMAKRYWPDQDPIGQQIIIGKGLGPKFEEPPRQIIGIVGDTRDSDLSLPPEPSMIIPQAQESDGMTDFSLKFGPVVWLTRTRVEPHQTATITAEQLRQASGGLPVGHIRTMDEVLSDSTARQNFNMILLGSFAAVALLLAAIGIYGVLAYSIAQRTHEIGIRMALGADRAHIRNRFLRQGLLLTLSGVVIGVAAAGALTRFIASFLFGVRPADPLVFIAVPSLLTLVALLAIWIPARRAARLDPIQSLRLE